MKKLLALQHVNIIEIFQMTELHEPGAWLLNMHVKEREQQKKRSTAGNTKIYYAANTRGEDQHERALKDALYHQLLLQKQQQQEQEQQQYQEEQNQKNKVPAWVRTHKAIIPDNSTTLYNKQN
jgi:hypothetical protein